MRRPRQGSLRLARMLARSSALLLGGAWLAAACGGEESPYDAVENWECFERKAVGAAGAGQGGAGADAPSCDCFGVKAGEQPDDPRPKVTQCSGWRCCYAWPNDAGGYDCRCEDEPDGVQLAGFCANAADERGGEVVEACPPTPRDNTSYCAFQGESCAPEYLEDMSLSGCCEGLACATDSFGSLVCR